MSIKINIGNRFFHCTRLSETDLKGRTAIYVIICGNPSSDEFNVLEVGKSEKLDIRKYYNDNDGGWRKNCTIDDLWVCVYPTPSWAYTERSRTELERQLRKELKPV